MNNITVGKQKTIKDLIGNRKSIYAVFCDLSVNQAAIYMRQRNIRAVGVMDASCSLVGVISHSDISNKVVAENFSLRRTIESFMSRNIVSVDESASVTYCLNLMLERDINHLVILDEDGKFMGLISRKDVDRACLDQLEEYAAALRGYISQV